MFTLLRRLRARLKYRHFERDLAREIDVHRAMKQDELKSEGVADTELQSTAARALGNVTLIREDSRSIWIARWIEQTLQDVRYAARSLSRQAGFSLASVMTLAVALGLLTSVFALYSALFLRPWSVPDPKSVFIVAASTAQAPTLSVFSHDAFERLASASVTADYAAMAEGAFSVATPGDEQASLLRGNWVTPNFMDVLKIRLQLGGGFASAVQGPAVVISDRVWRDRFGARPDAVGAVIHIEKIPATVVGVLAADFAGLPPRRADLLINMTDRAAWERQWRADRERCCVELVGRVRAGHTLAEASSETAATGPASLGTERIKYKDVRLVGTTTSERPGGMRREVPLVFGLLFTASALVLALACANVGNLHLARGLGRQRELALRLSIGATRSRIVRQMLTESLTVTVVAALIGLGVSLVLPGFVLQFDRLDGVYALSPDVRTFTFVAVAACLTCALFGLAPALRVTRRDVRGGLTGVAQGAGRLRSVILGTQVAVSAALVIATTLLVRGVVLTSNTDGGFALKQITVGSVMKPAGAYDADRNTALVAHLGRELDVRVGRLFALTETPPLSDRIFTVAIDGLPRVRMMAMSSSAFDVLGVPIIAGRVYSESQADREVVVNAALAEAAWPGQSPLGQVFDGRTVVGVAENARLSSVTETMPLAFKPLVGSGATFVMFRNGSQGQTRLREALAAFDSKLTLRARPLSAQIQDQLQNSVAGASVAGGVGVLTLLLAMVGVFGVCAFIVEERRREIGIRLALGAQRRDVRRTIVRAARWPLVGGLGCGVVLAVIAGFLLRSFLLGVSPIDPASYAIVFVLLLAAGAVATWLPLRRAVNVDPAITLRND